MREGPGCICTGSYKKGKDAEAGWGGGGKGEAEGARGGADGCWELSVCLSALNGRLNGKRRVSTGVLGLRETASPP